MENCVDRLNYLISLKKTKKDANKVERDEFANSWACLVEMEGFSERAEEFLYNGFTYCGAKPFKEYMKKQKCSKDVLDSLFKGKLFGDKCTSTTQILIHLLALSINDSQKDLKVIASIINKIPYAVKNKEGKTYGKVDRTIKKYFLDEIRPNTEFPDILLLFQNGLNPEDARKFAELLTTVIASMDEEKYSKRCRGNIEKIKIWINPPKEDTVEDKAENEAELFVSDQLNEVSVELDDKEREDKDSSDDKFEVTVSTNEDKLLKDLQEAINQKKLLENQREFLQNQLNLERENNSSLSNKLQAADKEICDLKKVISEDNTNLNLLNRKYTELQVQLEEMLKINSSQKIEIEQRTELIEMLRRDRSRQGEEAQNRLASKLRSYYEDYLDAEQIEMSIDLGENMRNQMGEIFKILSSAGFSIK